MILSKKNKKDVIRPRRVLFGEEWFCSPEFFKHDFFGVVANDGRPQPFPTKEAAMRYAEGEAERWKEKPLRYGTLVVSDKDYKEILSLTVT